MRAFEVAAAREKPPSVNLMRRAESVVYMMLQMHRFAEARHYLQHAFANASALPEPELRAKFVSRLTPGQVHLLAFSGATEEAEELGAAFVAQIAADPSLRSRLADIWLPEGLSYAQRQNSNFAAAIATAQRAEQRFAELKFKELVGAARSWRAAAELDAGHASTALSTAKQAMELQPEWMGDPLDADIRLVYGRALLVNGYVAEALEPLRQAYGFWLGRDSKSFQAAESEYWLGRAWIANGEVKRGRWMVAEAKRALAKSPFKLHHRLVAGASQVAEAAAPSSR